MENRNAIEVSKYYRQVIENKQDETLSDEEKQSVFYLLQKYIYQLGGGNWERGAVKFSELEKEKHEQEQKDNPIRAKFTALLESSNLTDRLLAEFILQGGLYLPLKDSKELQAKILRDEIYKSAMQPPTDPADLDTPTKTAPPKDKAGAARKGNGKKNHVCKVPDRVPDLEKWVEIYSYYEKYYKGKKLKAVDFYGKWQGDDERPDRPLERQMLNDMPRLQILLDEGDLGHIKEKAKKILHKLN
jgi:hypothetical protein